MSGNPQKRMETQQNKILEKEKKTISSTPIIIGIIALIIVVVSLLSILSYLKNNKFLAYENYVDEEKNIAVLTLPSSILAGSDAKESAKTLKESGGVTKVKVNDDNSITAVMTAERYEKFKSDAENAVNALPIMLISEDTAIRNYEANDDKTVIDMTVTKDSDKLTSELNDMLYIVRFYQVSQMNGDKNITVNFISDETGEVYKTEVYDITGEIVK